MIRDWVFKTSLLRLYSLSLPDDKLLWGKRDPESIQSDGEDLEAERRMLLLLQGNKKEKWIVHTVKKFFVSEWFLLLSLWLEITRGSNAHNIFSLSSYCRVTIRVSLRRPVSDKSKSVQGNERKEREEQHVKPVVWTGDHTNPWSIFPVSGWLIKKL